MTIRALLNKKSAKTAEMYIYAEIDPYYGIGAQNVADALKEIGSVDKLDVYFNSPGGSVFEGVAIYNQFARFKAQKVFHVDALAASIASVILMAGNEIVIADNAQIMIHDPWGMSWGTAEDMRKYAELLDQSKETILSTYVNRTKASRANIQAWMSAETWMTAQQAVKNGFANRIAAPESEDSKNASAAFPMVARYKNTPPEILRKASDSKMLVTRMKMRMLARQHKMGSPSAA